MPEKKNNINRLLEVMEALRHPETGCPWDVKQTSLSISKYAIEEAYEVVDAIERNDIEDLKDELGDLLLQVVFHSRIAEEDGNFDFSDVVDAISDKMIRRHPHVFGTEEERAAGAPPGMWDRIKSEEKAAKSQPQQEKSILDDTPVGLPGMTRAVKLQKKAGKVGFDWPGVEPVMEKIQEEIQELEEEIASQEDQAKIEEEYGDLLFIITNLGRLLKLNPETAMRNANNKFIRRFKRVEAMLKDMGKTPEQSSLEEMDKLWDAVKLEEKGKS